MEKQMAERAKRLGLATFALALGAATLKKHIPEKLWIKSISVWGQAKDSLWVELIEDKAGEVQESVRLTYKLIRGDGGLDDIQDVNLDEGQEISPEHMSKLEIAFREQLKELE